MIAKTAKIARFANIDLKTEHAKKRKSANIEMKAKDAKNGRNIRNTTNAKLH